MIRRLCEGFEIVLGAILLGFSLYSLYMFFWLLSHVLEAVA